MSQISKIKFDHIFNPQLKCSQHPIFINQFKNTCQSTLITYEIGPNKYPILRCESVTQEYEQLEEKCDKLLSRLAQHGNDIHAYRKYLLQSKSMRGNNRNKNCRQLNDLQNIFQWIQSEDGERKLLRQQQYFCHNRKTCIPIQKSDLTTKGPKLIFDDRNIAIINGSPLPKYKLLKQENNFRATITKDFGPQSFSKTYFFSKQLSEMKINVKGMHPASKTRNQEFKKIMEMHDMLPLTIKPSTIPNAGNGVFTLCDIPQNTMLMFYVGQQRNCFENWPPSDSVYDLGFVERIGETQPQCQRIFPLVVEPITKLNAARYINTNPKCPNLRMEKVIVNGMIGLLLVTTIYIYEGSQLFYPYGINYGFGDEFYKLNDPKGGQLSRSPLLPPIKRLIRQEQKKRDQRNNKELNMRKEKLEMEEQPQMQKMLQMEEQPQMEEMLEKPILQEQMPEQMPEKEQIFEEQSEQERIVQVKPQQQRHIEVECQMSDSPRKNDILDLDQIPDIQQEVMQKTPQINKSVQVKTSKGTISTQYVRLLRQKLSKIGSPSLNPSQKMAKLYRCYSRLKYRKFRHKYPRMRQAQVIHKIISSWQSLLMDQKVLLYQEYIDNKWLNEGDSDIDSEISDSQSIEQKRESVKVAPKKPVKSEGVRVFIIQDEGEMSDQHVSEEESIYEVSVEKKNKGSEVISLHELTSFIRRKIEANSPSGFVERLNKPTEENEDKKYNQLFEAFYSQPFLDETQRQRIRQYRYCAICDAKVEFSRLGNHLNIKHIELRQLTLLYQRIRFQQNFWAKIEYDVDNISFFDRWRIEDCCRKRSWFKKQYKQLMIGLQLQELPNDRKIALLQVRFTKDRRIVKVQLSRTGKKSTERVNISSLKNVQKKTEARNVVDLADMIFNIEGVKILDQKMRPVTKQTFIANSFVKDPIKMYMRKSNGFCVRLMGIQQFKERKIREKIKKQVLSNPQRSITQSYGDAIKGMTQGQSEMNTIDGNTFECPICNKLIPIDKQYHIASCLKYTEFCRLCDSRHDSFTPHFCIKSNNTINCNGVKIGIGQHVDMLLNLGRNQQKNQGKPLSRQQNGEQHFSQPQSQSRQGLPENTLYKEQNNQLRLMHLQREMRRKQEYITDDIDSLLIGLNPHHQFGLEFMNQKIKVNRGQSKAILTKRQMLLMNMKALYSKLKSPSYSVQWKIHNKQLAVCMAIIKYKIQRYQWNEAHNTCSICLSEMSPHIRHLIPKIVGELIERPEDIIAMEVKRISQQRYGKDHKKPDIDKESILIYANKLVIRECSKCTKVYHQTCWNHHEMVNGLNQVKCPNCRAQNSVSIPREALFDGNETEAIKMFDFEEVKRILIKLKVIKE